MRTYRFTLECTVDDVPTLYAAALKRARADGLDELGATATLRPDGSTDVEACLVMLLDPSTLDGCSIEMSDAECVYCSKPDET